MANIYKHVHNICVYGYIIIECVYIDMNSQFSDSMSVMGSIMTYLEPRDLARCRQVSRLRFANTCECAPNWQHYVQSNYKVRRCGQCNALRSMHKTEWCGLCEHWVCVDHLHRCPTCFSVYCSDCVFHCCR